MGFHKIFRNFRKKRFFHFFQKKFKIVFLVNFDLRFGKRIKKIRRGGCFWTYQNLFFAKYLKNKNFQFFPKKFITQKNEFFRYSGECKLSWMSNMADSNFLLFLLYSGPFLVTKKIFKFFGCILAKICHFYFFHAKNLNSKKIWP